MSEQCCNIPQPEKPVRTAPGLRAKIALYQPLLVILGLSLAGGLALLATSAQPFLNNVMALFLLFLAALQLFDLSGFAAAFAGYDLLAARSRIYARAYPLIEAALGCLYLAGAWPATVNAIMLLVMVIGTAGVVATLRAGRDVTCACAGAGFALPVGRVTLLENGAMGLMAAYNLLIIART